MTREVAVAVVGGGQAGLAASFYLRRAGLEHVVLDAQDAPGGAWRHTWPSLRLFSPSAYSSLPGRPMPPTRGGNPDADHVVDYLAHYEDRYDVPVHRPVRVDAVRRDGSGFLLETSAGPWRARALVSATGTWSRPFVPFVPGADGFAGTVTHSGRYAGPEAHRGRRVLVVGGGNSGAQIAADLAGSAEVTWCTLRPPRFLPDDVDGCELFSLATARVRGGGGGVGVLGDIVAVPPVRAARDAGLLRPEPMIESFTADGVAWRDGSTRAIDDVVWCTGFRPELGHLRPLDLPGTGRRIETEGPFVPGVPGLVLLGYGDWCGPASATLIGVGQWARAAARELHTLLS